MPTTLDPKSVPELETHPVLDGEDPCHVLNLAFGGLDTYCGAEYDCLPRPVCSHYSGQECCPDCGRPVCPACQSRMRDLGLLGGVRPAR